MDTPGLTPADIDAAANRIRSLVRTTPAIPNDGAELGVEGRLTFKLEQLQHSGTFKARGASSFLLGSTISSAGVVAASGGNHGAAVAWAAQQLGHKATIFVPTISSPAKVERLRAYGADVRQIGDVYHDSLEASEAFRLESGATGVHAYEDPLVMAGAGTTGREFEAQAGPFDTVLVACGGGGLVGGVATWLGDRTRVVACETTGTDCYAQARAAGQPVSMSPSGIAADALGPKAVGDLAFERLQAANAESVVVDDDAVVEARDLLWDRFRIVAEPSAAVPVAALLAGAFKPGADEHTGVIVCGANTTISFA
ncbi:MAG: serine/threonine dehydratase [Actinomycetota bacterium]